MAEVKPDEISAILRQQLSNFKSKLNFEVELVKIRGICCLKSVEMQVQSHLLRDF